MNEINPLQFKFQFVRDGKVQSMFSKKGSADENGLILGKSSLQYDQVIDTTTRDNRLIIVLAPNTQIDADLGKSLATENTIVLEIYKIEPIELERYIDRQCTVREVEKNKQRLAAEGKSNLFRTQTCQECNSIIDLSELDKSIYTYCRFCETVLKSEGEKATSGASYRVCDECNLFDRVRGYTEFYFYFLLVIYGYSYKRRHICDNCVDKIFWKMLLLNFIFIIGIPPAIYMKIKSLSGRDPYLKKLAKANSLAKKGKFREASAIYLELNNKYPDHPGLLMNQGLAHLYANDVDGAIHAFNSSAKSCSNYLPVFRLINRLQNMAQSQD